MDRWAVIFDNATDHPGLGDQHHKDAHHAYLTKHRDMIRLAGAVSDDKGREFSGGMWVVEANARELVQALVQSCPFYQSGVHKSYRIAWWGSAPGFSHARIVDAVEEEISKVRRPGG